MWTPLLDLLFPAKCASCSALLAAAAPFCPVCAESLVPIRSPMCTRCSLPFAGGIDHECASCAAHSPPYRHARASYAYGGELKTALLRFKYAGRRDLARVLGPLLGSVPPCNVIVPVPLHWRRLGKREFNQALELARAAWPVSPIDPFALVRLRDTPAQAGIDARTRRKNLRGVFRAQPKRVKGRHVVLVDDVMTTGATVAACARALRRAGAVEIIVVTLARTVP